MAILSSNNAADGTASTSSVENAPSETARATKTSLWNALLATAEDELAAIERHNDITKSDATKAFSAKTREEKGFLNETSRPVPQRSIEDYAAAGALLMLKAGELDVPKWGKIQHDVRIQEAKTAASRGGD